ncbi:MAG: hypothetical protein KA791_08070 [Flavobacteriales bacterium]|nr:hypothetical protein [Flavobacteriales bacterium]
MADLRLNNDRMTELLDHIIEREGSYPYFYCDNHGLVTIGIGYLVDQRGASDATGRRLATALVRRFGNSAFERPGSTGVVDGAAVAADWQRVKDAGRLGARSASRYASVAQLRLKPRSIRGLLNQRLAGFINTLYNRRPSLLVLDERVAMALVDARFNPAGVALYSTDGHVPALWAALDRSGPSYEPARAVALFAAIWGGRGGERYQQRHAHRVAWMRQGLGL